MNNRPAELLPDELVRFWRGVIDYVRDEVLPAWNKAMEDAGEAFRHIAEVMEEAQEREKQRAYEHLITPLHDHTRTHVTHTRTKPPAPARIYRRRTP